MSGMRLEITDLLAHAGARRTVTLESSLEGLEVTAARIVRPVRAEVTLQRISHGLVVRGELTATWQSQCSDCLRDLDHVVTVHVDELFETTPVEGETYRIEDHEIDLEQLVRDNLLLELPFAPHCDEPCEPVGVADGSSVQVPNHQAGDERWAALAELQL